MGEEENNFVKYDDFNIENLELKESVEFKEDNYHAMRIKYKYPDGKKRILRIRTPVLFSYGIRQNLYDRTGRFMNLLFYFNEESPSQKEINFKEVLNKICTFLREEGPLKYNGNTRKGVFYDLDISNYNVLYPKLKNNKWGSTNFYVKSEAGGLKKIDDNEYHELNRCEVIAYIDVSNIYVNHNRACLGMSLSDVIVLEEDVERITLNIPSKVMLYSDDEE